MARLCYNSIPQGFMIETNLKVCKWVNNVPISCTSLRYRLVIIFNYWLSLLRTNMSFGRVQCYLAPFATRKIRLYLSCKQFQTTCPSSDSSQFVGKMGKRGGKNGPGERAWNRKGDDNGDREIRNIKREARPDGNKVSGETESAGQQRQQRQQRPASTPRGRSIFPGNRGGCQPRWLCL